LDSLDEPNSRVVLVKTGDSSPSVPTSPGRRQPSDFPTGIIGGRRNLHVNPHRPNWLIKAWVQQAIQLAQVTEVTTVVELL